VLSGNAVQLPVHLPVNVSGNSVTAVGLGNAAVGNESTNTSGGRPHHPAPKPPKVHTPAHAPQYSPSRSVSSLAHTGTDQTVPAIAGGAALVLGGAVLYRRFRPAAIR
jgi:LPXTG-motif cell wall-anchored protein